MERSGMWILLMLRREGVTTRYPGVRRRKDGKYNVRFRITEPKTGRTKDIERVLESCADATEANRRRDELRREMECVGEQAGRTRLAVFVESWLRGKRRT